MITKTLAVSGAAVGSTTAPPTYRIQRSVLTDRYTAVVRGEFRREEFAQWLAGTFGAV